MSIFPIYITVAKGRNWGSGVEHLKNSALGNSFIMHSILHLVVSRIDGEFATPNNGAYRSLRGYHFFPQDDHGSGDRDRHGPPGYIYIYNPTASFQPSLDVSIFCSTVGRCLLFLAPVLHCWSRQVGGWSGCGWCFFSSSTGKKWKKHHLNMNIIFQ